MKEVSLLVWITQLGLSVAVPPVGFILLAKWAQAEFGWGDWVLWTGVVLGVICAVDGLIHSLRTLLRMRKPPKEEADKPVSFHEHN